MLTIFYIIAFGIEGLALAGMLALILWVEEDRKKARAQRILERREQGARDMIRYLPLYHMPSEEPKDTNRQG